MKCLNGHIHCPQFLAAVVLIFTRFIFLSRFQISWTTEHFPTKSPALKPCTVSSTFRSLSFIKIRSSTSTDYHKQTKQLISLYSTDMGLQDWAKLSALKRAVKKIRFILSFNINRWRLSSIIGSRSPPRLSFTDRANSGLRSFIEDIEGEEELPGSGRLELQRTSSYVSDEDIDSKADRFISNFYRQLQLERQISLELQYCRVNSMESTRSDW